MNEMLELETTRAARRTLRDGEADGRAADRLARGLGWFSVGLGLAQLASPRGVGLLAIGRPTRPGRMRALGVRELTAGLGILTRDETRPWLWARVAGDVLDLALLGSALTARRADRSRVLTSMALVAGVTALDAVAGIRARGTGSKEKSATVAAVTIDKSPDEVYRFWRDFRNFPRFMAGIESVELDDDRRSRWRARAPGGAIVRWEAEITEDLSGEAIAWRTLPGAQLPHEGAVTFRPAPSGRGTEVRVQMKYGVPKAVGKLLKGVVALQVDRDLRRFKQLLEVGEVLRSDATLEPGMHPAQPTGKRLATARQMGELR
jgi:uncharacterized membrane protein